MDYTGAAPVTRNPCHGAVIVKSWFPHRLENLEVGIHFPGRENSGNFEHAGKVRELYSKYWKGEGILASFFAEFVIEV